MKRLIFIPFTATLLAAGPVAAVDYSPATLRAIELLEAGKGKAGLAALEAAAARNDVSALEMLALIYLEAEQPEVALSQAEAAARLAPNDADVLVTRGKVFGALGQKDKARAEFDKVLASGSHAGALYERGQLRVEGGDHETALADFRLAFQIDPKRTDALLSVAMELVELKRVSEALATYDLLLKLEPDSPAVLAAWAEVHADQGDYAGAVAGFEAAIKLEPKDADLHVSLGAAWEKLGDSRRALAAYTAATRLDPGNLYGWWNAGRVLQAEGRWKPAVAAFDRAVALDPVNAVLLTDRGLARYDAGDDRALTDFDAALKADPKSTYSLTWRGAYFVDMDEPAKALVDLDAALKLEPDDPDALGLRARAMLMLSRHDRALADINGAIKSSKTPFNLSTRGEIYSAMGDHLQAIEAFDEAIALDPTYADAWLQRSKSKAEMGDKEAAAADRARALKLDPTLG